MEGIPNTIIVEFRTDHSNVGKGWNLEWPSGRLVYIKFKFFAMDDFAKSYNWSHNPHHILMSH